METSELPRLAGLFSQQIMHILLFLLCQPALVEGIKNAQQCVEVIDVELRALREAMKPYEERNAQLEAQKEEVKNTLNRLLENIRGTKRRLIPCFNAHNLNCHMWEMQYNRKCDGLIVSDHYDRVEEAMTNGMETTKEPLRHASNLLKSLVTEISDAQNNLQTGAVHRFEQCQIR